MLTRLHIENYAIIEHLDMDLYAGLNTITGQTGAGKSILLGALGLLSGGKAEATVIGGAGDQLVVEGEFDISNYGLEEFFASNDLEFSSQIVIRRLVSRTGKGRAFVDATPVGVGLLRELMARLVDIHSQHQTLLVSRADFQREILDSVACNGALLGDYGVRWEAFRAAEREMARVEQAVARGAERSEYLLTNIDQIEVLHLKDGEDIALQEEQTLLTNAEDIATDLSMALAAMDDEERGAIMEIKTAHVALARVGRRMAVVDSLAQRMESVQIELRDIAREVSFLGEQVVANPVRLQFVNQRLDSIYNVCKKQALETSDELIVRLAEFKREYMAISGGQAAVAAASEKVRREKEKLTVLASKLTAARAKAAVQLEGFVTTNLEKLGMRGARFKVEMQPIDLGATGADALQFMFAGGASQSLLPLDKVASGGEMSRVMLCLKAMVARQMHLPTIIFDEIDTGVSGAVADAMGAMVEAMGGGMQVINITHLAQVASKGEHHFLVYKDGATHIKELSSAERLENIASMLSGAEVTDAARAQAAALLKRN
ncbi:MAG: DNA repair protein RecN [Mucinivorans sp.]